MAKKLIQQNTMKKINLLFAIIFSVSLLPAQSLHSPAEIIKIMEKSVVTYEINDLTDALKPIDQSENLNSMFVYKTIENGDIKLTSYVLPEAASKAYDEAEGFFRDGNLDEALKMYTKTLELAPNFYHVKTYIGQIYYFKKDYKTAEKWYTEAIKNNSVDYMSYWFLADTYAAMGKNKKALDNILKAKILNRNNPRIQASLEQIVEKNKMSYANWSFNPQMRIDSIGDKKIRIAANKDWLAYALVEAVWMYDPAYDSIRNTFPINRVKEGVLAIAVTMDKNEYPEFEALYNAVKNKQLDPYIYYEILLVNHPKIAYYLTDEGIENILKYVKKTHIRKE